MVKYFLYDTQNGYVLRGCHSLSKILHDHTDAVIFFLRGRSTAKLNVKNLCTRYSSTVFPPLFLFDE